MNRFSLPRPDARQCVAGLGFSALLLLASSANAAACRDITACSKAPTPRAIPRWAAT